MSRFGYADSFATGRSAQECLDAARDALVTLGCRPEPGRNDMEISGRTGKGWAMRLLGGMIAPASWFPVRLSVSIHEEGDQREVSLRADEDFGSGSLWGVEQRMRKYCDDVGSQLGRLLRTGLD